jgi:ribosome-binding protein aMBF1 (putative translation factor)
MSKTKHLPFKKVLRKKLEDAQFRCYFDESRAVSELCIAIVHARQVMDLNQLELAKKVGTSQSVISRLENGNQGRMPSLDLLNRVAKALRLSLVVGFEKKVA